jgi:16S rRNA (guanine966-N2)-methyltransferase
MSDKIRGAVFNMLGDVSGLSLLDAFAGSGALSFEAISRGAASALAIDVDRGAINTVVNNLKSLKIDSKVKAIRTNASSWSINNPNSLFDIVLCDPPYDQINPKLLEKLAYHTKQGGVIVYSLPPKFELSLALHQFSIIAAKSYGDAKLAFYRRT